MKLFLLSSCLAATLLAQTPIKAADSVWVSTGVSGRLIYTPDSQGDRILDFSSAGYRGQGVEALPSNVAVAATVSPVAGDDTASIQAAIDSVSLLPIGPDGFRGAVQLTAGQYDIDSQLEIRASGVVLRGSGQGEPGTVLHGRSAGAEGTNQRPLIRVHGSGNLSNDGSRRNLIDKVVPVGATSFRVDVPGTFQAGDTVRVIRNTNDAWISELGMDSIPPRADGGTINQWTSSTINQRFDRVVTRVEGDRVFIDAPLPNAIEQHYGGGTIQKYNWSGAIENVGIENLRGESDFDNDTDEDHAWEFISIGESHVSSRAQNVWVRDVHARYFGDSLVVANPGTKWVTVQNAVNEDPKSLITGGRRYTYDLSGELGLVTNAQADEGRHDFVNNSTAPKGPNVFHNSTATNANSDSGPHQRWATGTLFDNVIVEGDSINARNRLNLGSGHGWSGANMTIWNSTADSFKVQNPPTAQNWLVGSTGTIIEDTQFGSQPSGYYDSHGTPVTVGGETSLYTAQMNDARDITSFVWNSSSGSWTDNLAWDQGVTPGTYAVMSRDYLLGDIDDYTNDGASSVDSPYVDATWLADIAGASALPIEGFDSTSGAANTAFTVEHTLDSGERVIHGSLALALRQTGGTIDAGDYLRLFNFDPSNQATFAELGWDSQINSSDSFVGVVDLSGSLSELQSGAVNVQLAEDVTADWAMYVATVATPIAGADSASVFIASGLSSVDSQVGNIGTLSVGGSTDGTLQITTSGELTVLDAYDQAASGKLSVEISSTEVGRITLAGQATLDGELEIILEPGYVPTGGESITVVATQGNVSGTFDTVTVPTLSNGLRWMVSQESAGFIASVVLAGDYNLDGRVDAIDYTAWRDSLNSSSQLEADGDGNGIIDGGDFLVWREAFGRTLPSSAIAIPEPATAGLLSTAALALLRRNRATGANR